MQKNFFILTFSKIKVFLFVAGMSMANGSQGASVEYTIEDRGRTIPQVANVSGHKVQIKAVGGDAGRDVLFDAVRQILFIIDHRKRSYTRIDNGVIDEVAVLLDSVSTVVGSQQGVLADLLGTLGLDAESAPRAKMVDVGRELNIGQYPCRLFQSHIKAVLQSEICMAENNALKLGTADFKTLRVLLGFGNRALNRAGKLLTALGLTLPEMNFEGSTGLPIGLHSAKNKLKVRVTQVSSSVSATIDVQPPAGYARESIPFISQ